ncbi:hypothetical protein [Aquamicrobium sp. LC103]|uniref:hypothetical protein n=1 Tax=Aquamicrobium sp. LC103 TaxID=1120658 RepID=UPI00063EA7A5|nr:hypothetical protein [Aquamicrobium sp. LC103]TKT78428.1 hypothetical protein XW59_012495 [Aquamicrobium sp. LC103]
MAITYPLDFLDLFSGWSTEFDPLHRQEQSRQANGRTLVKDLGSPLWRTTFQSRSMAPNELDGWRARLSTLEDGLQEFRAWPKSRCYPIAYPRGIGMGTVAGAQVDTINANRKAIGISGLSAGYRLSVGDYLRIGTADLHRVVEARVANASGVATQFEVRPHLWPLAAVGQPVSLVKPYCLMTAVPGSITTTADAATGRGVISFQAIESR